MGTNRKVSGPPWTERRVLAAELLDRGYSIKAVAEQLGLSPATARRYHAIFRADGKRALMRLGDVGRRRKLPAEGLSWLVAAIKHSPEVHGFRGEYWTNDAVGELINRQFQIRYSRSHINALIRELGLRERVP
ncbi:MAG TPA: helix-turn-helix domain-containing protein [Paraburkholderia sp.]|nr:helix-turn-helix domain-containing protein [Paraburkholderia sp.]